MRSRRSFALLALVLTTGCVVGPDYHPPSATALNVPAAFNAASPGSPQADADLGRWWQGFADPVLTQLVDRALRANLDVDVAGSRLRQSRASLRAARSAELPSLDFGGSVSRSIGRDGGDETSFQAGFDAAYEVDLFGGTRRSVEAARADAQGALASLHASQLSIAGEVAVNYVSARTKVSGCVRELCEHSEQRVPTGSCITNGHCELFGYIEP